MARRVTALYVVVGVATAAVLVLVIAAGRSEKPLPPIAGGYSASAPSPCLGPVPRPVGGIPLPPTAPAQQPPSGPAFNVLQSGQFVNVTNNQSTLAGQLRFHPGKAAGGGHRLTGTVDCVSGHRHLSLQAIAVSGPKGSIKGTLGGAPFAAVFKHDPPAPGTPAPRTPRGIAGKFALSPRSTCFGGTFDLTGSGHSYKLTASEKKLGPITYSTRTGAVFGDVRCVLGGLARLTATANDLQLQNVQVIPLEVAKPKTPSPPGAKPVLTTATGLPPSGEQFTATKQRTAFSQLVAAFFLAVAIVLIIARAFGIAAARLGQPRVMGEVIAGIVLGPSVLGAISPNLQAMIFPTDILPAFGVAANLGLIFYMFLIGLEIDLKQLKGKAVNAAAISNASVALPLMLGIAIALPLYELLGPNKKFVAFALFMGVAMSITAFPVLARILAERRMIGRPVGSLAIGCAAIDDVTAWFLIALATTIAVSGSFGAVAETVGEAAAFVLLMVFGVRRILARMATAFDEVGLSLIHI